MKFERKPEKENLRENKDIHLATLKKVQLEKRNAIIYIYIYIYIINRNGVNQYIGKCI